MGPVTLEAVGGKAHFVTCGMSLGHMTAESDYYYSAETCKLASHTVIASPSGSSAVFTSLLDLN